MPRWLCGADIPVCLKSSFRMQTECLPPLFRIGRQECLPHWFRQTENSAAGVRNGNSRCLASGTDLAAVVPGCLEAHG